MKNKHSEVCVRSIMPADQDNQHVAMQYADIDWQDGIPVNRQYDDIYFSRHDAIAESTYVYLEQNRLPQRFDQARDFTLVECGFGAGLNFLLTSRLWLESQATGRLYYFAVEKHPWREDDLVTLYQQYPSLTTFANEMLSQYPLAVEGFHPRLLFDGRVTLVLCYGDVADMLDSMECSPDAWYLDGFAPAKNPAMWNESLLARLKTLSHAGTSFSSFSVAGKFRRGLEAHGFRVERVMGFGNKREMLRGECLQDTQAEVKTPWFQLPVKADRPRLATVIGAGIAGVTTAWSLVKRGWQVRLVDRLPHCAGEASGNPAGIVMPRIALDPGADIRFSQAAFVFATRLYQQIKARHNTVEWHAGGVLQLSSSEYKRHRLWQFNDSALHRRLSADEASRIAGVSIHDDALFFPSAGWLDPRSLIDALLAEAGEGIERIMATEVKSLESCSDGWRLSTQCGQSLTSPVVVLANALACRQFEQTAWLPLRAARGQISLLPASEQSQQLKCVLTHEGYLIPAIDHVHVCGASFVVDETDVTMNMAEHRENLAHVAEYHPQFFDQVSMENLGGRVAVRAVTPDRMPLVGPVAVFDSLVANYQDLQRGRAAASYAAAEYHEGLYVNTGHGARGLTSCALSAEILASQIEHHNNIIASETRHMLHPSRIHIRQFIRGNYRGL